MSETVSKEDFQDYLKRLKGWKEMDRGSLDNLLKRLLAIKLTKEFQTAIEGLVGIVFKEIVNSDRADKSLIGELNQLKKKVKENEKVLQQQEKSEKIKGDTNVQRDAALPEALTAKLEGRHADYARHLYKSFIKNLKELEKHEAAAVAFIRRLESELYDFFEGDDAKILKHLQEIRFNMEPASANVAKLMMLEGELTVKDVVTNKSSTYTAQTRKDSEDGEKKAVPSFPKGHGQECEKCKQNEAYCWRMVQIRASDEPMTRFMRCRGCTYEWTDN